MDATETQELKDRLALIEEMMTAGRRSTESWGWIFVLWGVAYYVAIAWSVWGNHSSLAWSVTMMAAMILTFVIVAWRSARRKPRSSISNLGRPLTAIWMSVGISFVVLLPSLGVSGRSNSSLVIAVIGTLLGTANGASSLILRWKLQFGCAVVWWGMAVIACLGTQRQSFIALLVDLFFCQIVFGIYGMVCEAREARAVKGGAHA
jgi:hypothetical protein